MYTPISDHFYMPAEWHPHACCWMGWPCKASSWPFELTRVKAQYAMVAKTIAQFEPVKMITPSELVQEAKQRCGQKVEIVCLPIDDTWLRDTGPTFVINKQGSIAGVDWEFDAWGEKRENIKDYQNDILLAQRLLHHLHIPRYVAPFILEGGAIHVDGEGTLLTTEECLLSRNAHLTRQDIEELLRQYLGVAKILWLGQGLQDDETAGHVDNLACFISPGVVLALSCKDPKDGNYAILQDNLQRLRKAKDAQGRSLEVIEIEQPAPREDAQGVRLALSYVNFHLANGGIIVPIFGDPADQEAISTLTRAFPTYEIVPVEASDIVYGGGNIHCMTQQQPISLSVI